MIEIVTDSNLIIALTTEANTELAENLARELLTKKVASCISLNGIKSIFWWNDGLEESEEVQLIIKTTRSKLDLLIDTIEESHSYQLPEVLFWNTSASVKYKNWVEEVLST